MTENLKNRIVLITGATAGIGEATAEAFAEAGSRLILTGRRKDRLDSLAGNLNKNYDVKVLALRFDVRDQKAVLQAIETLPAEWSSVDILVNNAGLGRGLDKLHEGKIDDWEEMIDTNVKGLLYVSRAVIPGMVARQTGHVINMGSAAGYETYPGGNVYCATKYAVRALTQSLRMELVDTPIRVTSIDPGLVETEFSVVRFNGDKDRAKKPYEGLQPLVGKDIAELIVFSASRPPHVNINEITVMPKGQASTLVYHRKS